MISPASVPKRPLSVMLLMETNVGLNVQVNSALANPPAGTLFKLTVAVEVPPAIIVGGLRTVVTYADVGVEVAVDVVVTARVGVADGTKVAVGIGVFVVTGVLVATCVLVATGVLVAIGVLVDTGVLVGAGVLVKAGVFVGGGVAVAATCRIVRL